MPRALQKQADKELKWSQIAAEEVHLYKQAGAKQWREHLKYEAVKILTPEEARKVRARVPRDRILKARFAYRDKNCAKRREDSSTLAKPTLGYVLEDIVTPTLLLDISTQRHLRQPNRQ